MIPRPALKRRSFLAGTAGAAGILAAPSILRAQERRLRILTWEGYADDAWVQRFRDETGAQVSIVYSGSADEMFARMQGSGGADFDLVSFDTSLFPRYIGGGLVKAIDRDRLPSLASLAPEFADVPAVVHGGELFGVPFAWGSLPLVYDADAFPEPPASWEVMWDPAHAQRMLWQDDANNSITLGALIVGAANPFQLTDDDFAAIRAKLVEQKRLLLSYYAGFDDGVNLFAQNGCVLMYSMGEPQVPALRDKGVNAALTIPREKAVGWLDCWELSSGVQDEDLAYAWINILLDAEVGRALTETFGYGNTTNVAVNEAAGMTYGDKLAWLETAENYEKRVAVWNEIKAA